VLHNDVESERRLNDLVHLNYVWVAHYLQNVDLASDTLYVIDLGYLVFLENFNGDSLARKQVDALFYFAKSALAQCFCNSVAADDLLALYLWIFI